MITIKCDRCGKPIESTGQIRKIYIYDQSTNDLVLKLARDTDLCEECYKKLYFMIGDFFTFKEKKDGRDD